MKNRKTTLTFSQLKKLVNEDSCVSFTGWGMGRNKKESIRRFVEHLHSLEHELEDDIIDYDGYPEMVKRSGMDYAFDDFKDDICGWGTETTSLNDALDVNFDIDGEYASLLPDELKPYMEEDSGGYLVFDSERWLKNLFVRVVKGLDSSIVVENDFDDENDEYLHGGCHEWAYLNWQSEDKFQIAYWKWPNNGKGGF